MGGEQSQPAHEIATAGIEASATRANPQLEQIGPQRVHMGLTTPDHVTLVDKQIRSYHNVATHFV